eukprot:Plantae.Rhodophyta-Hildenbrandia_rubra.ctg49529.p2 GENE.Plantae.Rhodophyta-Hildenbrandia_rubra.ctg49529~~Plantae.Rhodophyta-Hildenbrandia_rubra.ctg49529.p2  ORF type:complete len:108 (-),score=18.37 Plantae.Rhodophyta-Hildenbrandia_rubra.ctg49529:975-1298(-)
MGEDKGANSTQRERDSKTGGAASAQDPSRALAGEIQAAPRKRNASLWSIFEEQQNASLLQRHDFSCSLLHRLSKTQQRCCFDALGVSFDAANRFSEDFELLLCCHER